MVKSLRGVTMTLGSVETQPKLYPMLQSWSTLINTIELMSNRLVQAAITLLLLTTSVDFSSAEEVSKVSWVWDRQGTS